MQIDQDDRTAIALKAFSLFGAGEIIGSILQGFVIDSCGPRSATGLLMVILIAMTALTCYNLKFLQFGILSYIMNFLWGL